MCGRFTLVEPSYEELAETLGVAFDSAQAAAYKPRYNIAPTDPHWVMHMESGVRELMSARGGSCRGGRRPATTRAVPSTPAANR